MNGIALLRCFIYGGYTFYIMPTVQSEYLKTFDEELREKLKRTHDNMFLNRNPCPDHTEVNNRKNYYLGIHNEEKDCQIIAEAEISNINILLTNDKKLYNKVHLKTKSIKIMRAHDFWERLNIPKGTSPLNEPSHGNFLCGKVWWRW